MKLRQNVLIVGMMTVLVFALGGCQANAEEAQQMSGVPVEVMNVESVMRDSYLYYKGTVVPEGQLEYAFKSSGRLESLNIKPGDSVQAGDVLATLENTDLQLQLSSALAQLQSARKDVNKAKESWRYNKEQLDKMTQLYKNGAISQNQLDQIDLSYEISQSSLAQAQEATRAAQAAYDMSNRLLEDAVLIAQEDGIVLSTEAEVGELIGAQNPVVIMQSETQVVQVGISESDIDHILMETPVLIDKDGSSMKGTIIEINNAPDLSTRTYLVKTLIDTNTLRIGAITDVKFNIGKEDGVWIPTQSVLSDGEKFVYVVENGRVFKRTISVEAVDGFELKVTGLEIGSQVVVSGMKKLTDGAEVIVVEG